MTDKPRIHDRELSREERLAAKLRENLRRRKAQAREITGSDADSMAKSALPKTGRES